MDNIQIADEALVVANAIQAVCEGKPTTAVLVGISMVLGAAAAMAERPDFEGLMALVEKGARFEFDKTLGGTNG